MGPRGDRKQFACASKKFEIAKFNTDKKINECFSNRVNTNDDGPSSNDHRRLKNSSRVRKIRVAFFRSRATPTKMCKNFYNLQKKTRITGTKKKKTNSRPFLESTKFVFFRSTFSFETIVANRRRRPSSSFIRLRIKYNSCSYLVSRV